MVVLGGTGWSFTLRSIPTGFVAQLSIFKFIIYFYELHHLLVEVHLVLLLTVHQGLLLGGPWWNEMVLGSEKNFPKFHCSTLNF